eukprot:COSAG01_NODE_26554_length_710_cov_1.098200_2_plen_122_part_00
MDAHDIVGLRLPPSKSDDKELSMTSDQLRKLIVPVFEAIATKVADETGIDKPQLVEEDKDGETVRRWYRELRECQELDSAHKNARILAIVYTHCVWKFFWRMRRFLDRANEKKDAKKTEPS